MNISRRRGTLLALATALLLGTTACAGGASGSGDEKTIRVGQSSKSPTMLPLYVAVDKGYFEQAGIKVAEPTVLPSGSKLAAAIAGRSIDVGIGVTPDVFNMYGSRQAVKIIGSVYPSYYIDIVKGSKLATPSADADLVTRIKALRDKKIGITGPGSGTEALLTYLFRKAGMDSATDAQVVSLGSDPSAAIIALKSGKVDAVSHILSVGQQAEAEGVGQLYISPGRGDVPELKGTLHGVAYALEPTLKEKKPAVQAFLSALQKGMDFVHQNPAEAQKILEKRFSGMSPEVIKGVSETVVSNVPATLAVDSAGYQTEATMLAAAGILKKPAPPLNKLTAPDLSAGSR